MITQMEKKKLNIKKCKSKLQETAFHINMAITKIKETKSHKILARIWKL